MSYFEKALEKEPALRKEAANLIFEQAKNFLQETEKVKVGIELLETAQYLDAMGDLSNKIASEYFKTGMTLLSADSPTYAESLLSKALELNPTFSDKIYSQYLSKGSEYFAKGEYETASQLYGNGLKICLDKDTHSAACVFPHYFYAVTRFIHFGRTAGNLNSSEKTTLSNIIKHFEVVTRLDESHAGAHTYLYVCYNLADHTEKALNEFELTVKFKPIEDNWGQLNSSRILNKLTIKYHLNRDQFYKNFEAYDDHTRNMI